MSTVKRFSRSALAAATLLALCAPAWAQRGAGQGMQGRGGRGACLALSNSLASTPKQELSSKEIEGLAYMREKEKLTHDLYAALDSKWNLRSFGRIAQREEQHSSAITSLLNRYQLSDPAAGRPAGEFRDRGIQTLYRDLLHQGESSPEAALRAGAAAEELSVRDLENASAATDNNDLKLVYSNLLRASENHLRAFTGQLSAQQGGSYKPQYLSAERFAQITSRAQGSGRFGARGAGGRGLGRGANGSCPNCQWMNDSR